MVLNRLRQSSCVLQRLRLKPSWKTKSRVGMLIATVAMGALLTLVPTVVRSQPQLLVSNSTPAITANSLASTPSLLPSPKPTALHIADSSTKADSTTVETLDAPDNNKADYKSVSIDEFKSQYKILDDITPNALAVILLEEEEDGQREEVIVDYHRDGEEYKATVIRSGFGLHDDSIAAHRYRIEMAFKEEHWRFVWIGWQQLCRRVENPSWTTQNCP